MPEASRAVVRAKHLIAVQPFQSTEETRYYLNGICIQGHAEGGALLIATDGHIMPVLYDPDASVSGPRQIWKMDWAKRVTPALKAADYGKTVRGFAAFTGEMWVDLTHDPARFDGARAQMRLVQAETAAEVRRGFGVCQMTVTDRIVIDGSFPEWQRVAPRYVREDAQPTTFIQARYVAKIAKFLQDVTGEPDTGMVIQSGASDVSVVRAQAAGDRAFIVAMGLRGAANLRIGLPDWFDTIDAAKHPPAPEFEAETRTPDVDYGLANDDAEADMADAAD